MTLETQIDAPAIDSGAILAEFDTLDRLSYIGKLYREIDLIDFSAPVIEYLVNNPIPKQAEIKVEKISATVTKSDLGFMSYDDTIRHTPKSIEDKALQLLSKIDISSQSREYKKALAYTVTKFIEEANKFTSVQPLAGPIGMVFKMRHKVAESGNSTIPLQIAQYAIEAGSRKVGSHNVEHCYTSGKYVDMYECIFTTDLANILESILRSILDNTKNVVTIEQHENFVHRLTELAINIEKRSKRGFANVLIISDKSLFKIINKLYLTNNIPTIEFHRDNVNDFVLKSIGTVHGIKIYSSTELKADEMLLGYRGSADADAGSVFAPYNLLNYIRVVDPYSFTPMIQSMTRSGMEFNDVSDYYTKIIYK